MLTLLVLGLGACEKPNNPIDTPDDGGINPTTESYIKVNNVCEYPFKIFIDGNYKSTINGGASNRYAVNVGSRRVKIEQVSGHFQYPLQEEFSVSCINGYEHSFNIPTIRTGQIKVVNYKSDPYDVKINGANKVTIAAFGTEIYEVDAWREYNVYLKQKSGYIFYPTEITKNVKVDANYIYTIEIK